MKYAIYDKAADGYLTKMVFEVGYSQNTQFECALTEYITNAELLDTKEAATTAIANIEGFKFMEKGRFVVHSFDDELADQYIISEAGNPTKVVDNITVDLDGTINVKYGTMALHWSASSLGYVINRLNRLQDTSNPLIYKPWYNTFKIYKVITIIDEKEHTHYQFINVTIQGLVKYEKDEEEKSLVVGKDITDVTDPLNKRIEELEASNNGLRNELYDSERKIECIKKEAHTWKSIHKSEGAALGILKDVIDTIYTDLQSVTACDDLKDTLKALSHNSDLDHIFMPTKTSYILDNGNCLTAKDEIYYIVNQMIVILESRELNQSVAFSSAEEVDRAKKLANDIIDICEATTDPFEVTLKKFSQLYEAVNDPSDDDDTIMHAFKAVLEIFSALEDKVRNIIDESVTWKHKAIKAEKALAGQKALNNANADTIERMRMAGADWKRRAEDAIHDYTKCNEALGEWKRKYKAKDADYEMLQNKLKACEIILESIQSSLTATIKERDKAIEQKEFYRIQANSVYGMTVPCGCNSKQMFYDVATGKKILVDKEKYDNLVECVNTINTTYDILKCADFTMNKPVWFDGIIHRIKNLTI